MLALPARDDDLRIAIAANTTICFTISFLFTQTNLCRIREITRSVSMNFSPHLSDLSLFVLLIVTALFVSTIAITLVKRYIPHDIRSKDNPVIGNMVGLISIIYGVLAGLTALYLVNNVSYASAITQDEANAAANVLHTSQWLNKPTKTQIQNELMLYLTEIIDHEWPLMREGKPINSYAANNIEHMSSYLRSYPAHTTLDALIIQSMMQNIQTLYETRQDRIAASQLSLSNDVWIVVLLGTILTIVINYLFAMNFYMHIVTASASALMCFAMIFLLVTLDHPFQGDFVIEPDVYKPLLNHIKHNLQT